MLVLGTRGTLLSHCLCSQSSLSVQQLSLLDGPNGMHRSGATAFSQRHDFVRVGSAQPKWVGLRDVVTLQYGFAQLGRASRSISLRRRSFMRRAYNSSSSTVEPAFDRAGQSMLSSTTAACTVRCRCRMKQKRGDGSTGKMRSVYCNGEATVKVPEQRMAVLTLCKAAFPRLTRDGLLRCTRYAKRGLHDRRGWKMRRLKVASLGDGPFDLSK
jgi:hypothetical protein